MSTQDLRSAPRCQPRRTARRVGSSPTPGSRWRGAVIRARRCEEQASELAERRAERPVAGLEVHGVRPVLEEGRACSHRKIAPSWLGLLDADVSRTIAGDPSRGGSRPRCARGSRCGFRGSQPAGGGRCVNARGLPGRRSRDPRCCPRRGEGPARPDHAARAIGGRALGLGATRRGQRADRGELPRARPGDRRADGYLREARRSASAHGLRTAVASLCRIGHRDRRSPDPFAASRGACAREAGLRPHGREG